MSPDQILIIAQLLLKYGPDVANGVANIFQKPAPTWNDWQAVFNLARNPIATTADMPAGSPV